MRNKIKNWNGREIAGANQPSMEMIRLNNISIDDIKFIIYARNQKKKSLHRQAKALNCFFDALYMLGFIVPLMGTGGLIEKAEHLNLNLLKEIGILWAVGILMIGVSYARQRYIRSRIKNKINHIMK